jgi:hypothetical protein
LVRRTAPGACCIPTARAADRLTSAAGMGALAPMPPCRGLSRYPARLDRRDACAI